MWKKARYRRLQRRLAGPRLIRAFADAYPEAFFIEVGSNDGEQHDHLRPFILELPWEGIMVEPVPYVFERLRRNYARLGRVALENVAIADHDGELEFHYLRESSEHERRDLPDWYDGIGSLSRERVLSHAPHVANLEGRLVREDLPCLTFESLCRKHAVGRIDLLLIDTEGHDWEIIRDIDLDARRPRLLIYEHFHLTADDRARCRAHVESAGYETMEEGFDTFCLEPRAGESLMGMWSGLQPAVPGVSAYD